MHITYLYDRTVSSRPVKDADNTPLLIVASKVYFYGPNWIANESMPIDYYTSCGNNFVLIKLRDWFGHCSAGDQLKILRYTCLCLFYCAFYGSNRNPAAAVKVIDWYPVEALLIMIAPSLVCFILLGIINYVIMTRVQKQIEGGKAGPLLFHQVEIFCDIATPLIIVSGPIVSIVLTALTRAVTGTRTLVPSYPRTLVPAEFSLISDAEFCFYFVSIFLILYERNGIFYTVFG